MRLDSLVNAITSADFTAFREIALLYLDRRGFRASLADGPHDGGADFLSFDLLPSNTKFAVQVSIEKNWQKKLRTDAAKARKILGVEHLLFLSSRVITQPAFQQIADELLSTNKIVVQKADAKDIASLAELRGFATEILRKLGYPIVEPVSTSFTRPDLRRSVAYACAFFGTDAQAFRKTVIENATLAAVFEAGGSAERDTVVDRVALSLGLTSNQRAQVTSAMDRMLQEARLTSKNGTITLDAKVRDNWATASALREREKVALTEQVDALLASNVKRAPARKHAVDIVLEDLGALWLAMGRATSDALGPHELSGLAQDPLRDRLRHLDATLDTLGVVDKGQRETLLRELGRLAAGSSFGRSLAAGEIFINLTSMKTPHLFRAFGGGRELCTLLDTSVAMPLLCSLLFDSAQQDFFIAAKHAYDQLAAHGAAIVLPASYLEEVASHLLNALNYREIVDLDRDLRRSKNAFVAHYVALRGIEGDKAEPFVSYLSAFGVKEASTKGDPNVLRDVLMKKLAGHFQRYGIRIETLSPGPSSEKRAQEALAYAMRERNDLDRPSVLVRHDVATLGWLLDHASDTDLTYVICTWDKLHPYVQRREDAEWDVLDPVALGDVLSLAAPGSEDVTFVSPIVVALALSADAEQQGAAVWDRLVDLEKERLHDARLLAAARAFKQNWVDKAAKDKRPLALQGAWEAWKETHLQGPAKGG